MLFSELFDLYYQQHLLVETRRPDTALWVYKHLAKQWADRDVESINKKEVQKWAQRVRAYSPDVANKCLIYMSASINWGVEYDHISMVNPCRGVKKSRREARERFLLPDEVERFLIVLKNEPQSFQDFFLVCLFTSARKGNTQAMRWDQMDLNLAMWRIPKTKNGSSQIVALSAPALEILKRRKADSESDFVFPGKGKRGHMVNPWKSWNRVIEAARLDDLRIHDLRRTLPSYLAINGASTYMIGQVLGHKDPRSTAIYARLHLDPVRAALEDVTKRFA